MVHSRGQTWMEFGTGDVDLFVSYDDEHSLVVMENAPTPREIGKWKTGKKRQKVSAKRFSEAPAVMSFTNVESIDAVICSLSQAREAFLQHCGQEVPQ